MIELTFLGNDNAMSGPNHDDIGSIYFYPGAFSYQVIAPAHTVPPYLSWIDPLFDASANLIGSVYIPQEWLVNGTAGAFFFYPYEGIPGTSLDQVYATPLSFYRGASSTAVPETSTWLMMALGFALLFTKTRALAKRPCR